MSQQMPSVSRITLLFEKFSNFVEGYGANLSLGGMFLETEDERPVGSIVDFEIKLSDGFQLIYGLGEVVWRRTQSAGPDYPVGLGVRFQMLEDSGRELILKILEERVRNGMAPFDVEEIPDDVKQAAVLPEPFAGDPSSSLASPAAAAMPAPPMAAAPVPPAPVSPTAEAATTPPPRSPPPPDLEQKILGEDGFTLIDSEQEPVGMDAAPTDDSFEQLEFDAPWGEALPDLPEEVLEEDQEAESTAGNASPAMPVPEVTDYDPTADAFDPPAESMADAFDPPAADAFDPPAESIADAFDPPAADAFDPPAESMADAFDPPAADAFDPPAESIADAFDPPAADAFDPPAESMADAFEPQAADAFDPPAADAFDPPAADAFDPPAADAFDPPAADAFGPPDGDAFETSANTLEPPMDSRLDAPDFDLDDSTPAPLPAGDFEPEDMPPGLLEGDFVAPPASAEESRSPEDVLEDSFILAAQAAEEIQVAPPPDEALAEPDFDEIDFGSPEEGEDRFAAPAATTSDAAFAFEPAPEDEFLSSESSDFSASGPSESAFATQDTPMFLDDADDEDLTIVGSGARDLEEDATVLTSGVAESNPRVAPEESFAGVDPAPLPASDPWTLDAEDPFAVDGEDATEAGSGARAVEPQASEPWTLESSPTEVLSEPVRQPPVDFESVVPSFAAPTSMPAEPAAEADDSPASIMPESTPAVAADEGTVTVAGAPVSVQDYEDDLFADSTGANSGGVARKAFSIKTVAVFGLLAALVGGAYVYRAPLMEMAGLAEPSGGTAHLGPPPDAPPASTTSDGTQVADATPDPEASEVAGEVSSLPSSEVPETTTTSRQDEPSTPEVASIGAQPEPPVIEEVNVSETLPAGDSVAGDPEAAPGVVAPSLDLATAPLASSSSSASRVERITWRPSGEGTWITVSLDGSLSDERYEHMTLAYNASREMIKIVGIEEPYASRRLDVGSPELLQIRTGHHARAQGLEIHIVFDYPDAGSRVADVRNLGDRLEILIAGR